MHRSRLVLLRLGSTRAGIALLLLCLLLLPLLLLVVVEEEEEEERSGRRPGSRQLRLQRPQPPAAKALVRLAEVVVR